MRARFWASLSCIALLIIGATARAQTGGATGRTPAAESTPQLTWDNLEARMAAEESAGFSGSLLVVRGDRVVLDRGYGLANREAKIAATPETVYGIGSTPIDFTRAAILLLAQEGKLALADPVTRWFDNVPADKRSITIEHLMQGRSGLQNFHDIPGDRDPDHTWIDRAEAVRRIWAQKLLFEPGKGREHSHSAWGILAAIVELASGQTYPEFTRERLFEPAGMKDTGFFGEPVAPEKLAIAYGPDSDGTINAPPYWGPTSWLVMGSGGQVSTTRDMQRWIVALREGRILAPEWLEQYWGPPGSAFSGGDMYGYEIMYTRGPSDYMILIGNVGGGDHFPRWQPLARDLIRLVNARTASKYTLGIQMDVRDDERIAVVTVVPGSAAERDGIRVGDILITAGGQPLEPEPMRVLTPYLASGDAIEFEIERAGVRHRVRVTPKPRD
jgi:CubicO group peptidase (beta-lactamase class C family)